jgi:hypothetical protein
MKIGATYSSLYAIADNGKLYTWGWKSELPSNKPHPISEKLSKENEGEKIIDMATSSWRIAILTNKRRVASFVDEYCGESLCSAFFTGFIDLPTSVSVERLMVCPLYAAFLTSNNKIYWWYAYLPNPKLKLIIFRGVYPFSNRMQMFENVKKKGRDEPATRGKEITIGSEVRTRAIPIYASGSVGVNFSSGIPMVSFMIYLFTYPFLDWCSYGISLDYD